MFAQVHPNNWRFVYLLLQIQLLHVEMSIVRKKKKSQLTNFLKDILGRQALDAVV